MKLYIASDLHLEHARNPAKVIDKLTHDPNGTLVLAGDVHSFAYFVAGQRTRNQLVDDFKAICDRYANVVYVLGNHEYYGLTSDQALEAARYLEHKMEGKLHRLCHGKQVILDGQRFLGDTGFYPATPDTLALKGYINDFHAIRDAEPFVYEHFEAVEEFLDREVKETDIVVTHHAPTPGSIHSSFVGYPSNCYFQVPLEHIVEIKQPKLYIHGHVHNAFDYAVGKTRVVCNPHAYSWENRDFKVLEITI